MIKLDNITLYSEKAVIQDAFSVWVSNKIAELEGPNGELPPEQEIEDHLWEELRKLRNKLLAEDDYLFLSDSPAVPTQELIQYRQKLRDIPQEFTNVLEVVLPEKT